MGFIAMFINYYHISKSQNLLQITPTLNYTVFKPAFPRKVSFPPQVILSTSHIP